MLQRVPTSWIDESGHDFRQRLQHEGVANVVARDLQVARSVQHQVVVEHDVDVERAVAETRAAAVAAVRGARAVGVIIERSRA